MSNNRRNRTRAVIYNSVDALIRYGTRNRRRLESVFPPVVVTVDRDGSPKAYRTVDERQRRRDEKVRAPLFDDTKRQKTVIELLYRIFLREKKKTNNRPYKYTERSACTKLNIYRV